MKQCLIWENAGKQFFYQDFVCEIEVKRKDAINTQKNHTHHGLLLVYKGSGVRVHCVPDGQQEELRDGGEELEAPLEEVLVQQAGVRAGLGLAQFLSGKKKKTGKR